MLRRIEATRKAGPEELGVLEANLRQVESEVREIEEGIVRMTRVAPRDGIVIHVTNWRNEKKKVGDPCSVRDMVLEIPDLGRMEADGEVEEARAGRVREGQRVVLRLDAYPDREYQAPCSSILTGGPGKELAQPAQGGSLDARPSTRPIPNGCALGCGFAGRSRSNASKTSR